MPLCTIFYNVGLSDPTPEGPAGDAGGDNSVKNANAGISDTAAGNDASGQNHSLNASGDVIVADATGIHVYICMYSSMVVVYTHRPL
jgi:hypothetical protein